MAWDALDSSEIQVGKPVSVGLMEKIKGNLDYLYGLLGIVGSIGINNGSFEIDSDEDGYPDSWDIDLHPNGAFELDATEAYHGIRSIKFTHPGGTGNGGGYATTDYIECEYRGTPHNVSWAMMGDANIRCLIQAIFYDADKVELSTSSIYNSTSIPTSWTRYTYGIVVPTGAYYLKLRFHGGYIDYDNNASIWFDNIVINDPYARALLYSYPGGTWVKSSEKYLLVQVYGGGGGSGLNAGSGGTSNFGGYYVAYGGGGNGGTQGYGTGGQITLTGGKGIVLPVGTDYYGFGGQAAGPHGGPSQMSDAVGVAYGGGAGYYDTSLSGAGGSGGGCSIGILNVSNLTSISATVGAAGAAGTYGNAGAAGAIIVYGLY